MPEGARGLALAGAATVLLSACGGGDMAADVAAAPAVAYTDGVYDGPRVENARGGYQAQVTIEGGEITAVDAIEAGTSAPESLEINARAIPELEQKVIAAQSADVEHVSGSSFTSPAFLESVDGALADAAEG